MDSQVEKRYLSELLIQSEYALEAVVRMNRALADHGTGEFFYEAQSFVAHAAAMSRILWPPWVRDNARRERAEGRGVHLRRLLGIGDEHPLRKRSLRDHLEHFDERLDAWAEESAYHAVIDLHIGPISVIGGIAVTSGDFLRAYDPSRKVFMFRGEDFDVQAMVSGVEVVRAAAIQRSGHLERQAAQPAP